MSALPTTPVGKIFKPALILREMEALVAHEAQACDAAITYSEAVQDPRLGLMLKWSASVRSDEIRARLDKYRFRHEQDSPVNNLT